MVPTQHNWCENWLVYNGIWNSIEVWRSRWVGGESKWSLLEDPCPSAGITLSQQSRSFPQLLWAFPCRHSPARQAMPSPFYWDWKMLVFTTLTKTIACTRQVPNLPTQEYLRQPLDINCKLYWAWRQESQFNMPMVSVFKEMLCNSSV